MKGKPDLRLMVRSGIPVAKLLLAQQRHAWPSPWMTLEYVVVIVAIAATTAFAIYGGTVTLAMLGL